MKHDNPKSKIDHEVECARIIKDNAYANTIEPALGLTYLQLEAMRLLSMPDRDKLNDNQAELVRRFVESAKGDQALNKNVKNMTTLNLEQQGLSKDVMEMVRLFTDKTRHVDVFSSAFNKLTQHEVSPLTLKEYAVVLDFVKTKKFFDLIQSKIELKGELATLAQQVAKTPTILTTIDEEAKKAQLVRPGALLFDHTPKMTLPYHNLFNHLVTKHSDRMTLQPGKPTTGGIDEFNMRDYLYSDNYSIKIETLISERNQDLLTIALGPNWLEEVKNTYATLERKTHDDLFRQYAGMAPLSAGTSTDAAIEHDERMLCSEFVALTTVATLNALDTKLKEVLKSKNSAVPVTLIAMPLSADNLSQMTPNQTLKNLIEKGVVGRSEPRNQFAPRS